MPTPEGLPEEQNLPGVDLELLARRQAIAQRAAVMVGEVLDFTGVSVDLLLVIADEPEQSRQRLRARRALRAIEGVAAEDSQIVERVGETGLYHYVEGVVEYGASDSRYLALMEDHGLTAEEATGMYDLRARVHEETSGRAGFEEIISALERLGITPQQAAADPEAAVAALDEDGCFVDYIGSKQFERPIFFALGRQGLPRLGRSQDTQSGQSTALAFRDFVAKHIDAPED